MKGNNPQTQEVNLFPIVKTKRHGDKFSILVSSEQEQREDVKINQIKSLHYQHVNNCRFLKGGKIQKTAKSYFQCAGRKQVSTGDHYTRKNYLLCTKVKLRQILI